MEVRPIPASNRPRAPKRRWKTWWLKQLHTWHWISAAVSLVAMLLFAITGITLNHAAAIPATPVTHQKGASLPAGLRAQIAAPPASADAPLPSAVARAVAESVGLDPAGRAGEWSDGEVYVALPRPGGDAWVSIDRRSGQVSSEVTNRGWISYLNDLHKGRNAGTAWFWFIDIFAGACILFTLTGLLLLQLHARHRPSTWPLVAAGFAVPFIIAMFFIH
ncbi:PepSY-associated TM helix domain-containing protein [Sphingomonas aquatilis]|uniref:PepSY-associated TM helix domain-containing protein n=1 Tax=Sphingomonas aquatilis TaxID=93063 RepID=UPI0023F693E8|nr:PepSY-associated TM helix domain-containing protein [Sphingomonas aquatilis]MCI4654029.1 PepSY-associated TM helix domain-containing protein [Sphingomonas aquatilis]